MLKRDGKKEKEDLTKSPFVIEFNYGAQNKGYWLYEHFVLQCEDVADCLSILHPEVNVHFCVDHSYGHDCQQDDGLNVTKMNKIYSTKQQVPHDSVIKNADYLGPYPAKLTIGATQQFAFTDRDNGPFWLKPAERLPRKYNVKTGKTNTRTLSVKQLMLEIKKMPSM